MKLAISAEQIKSVEEDLIMSEDRSKIMDDLVRRDEERLRKGSEKVNVLVGRVERERDAVMSAMKDLEEANRKAQSTTDPLYKIASFRDQPLPKQAALTASLLFAARTASAIISDVVGGGGNDGIAIAVQAGIAIAAAVVYFL